MVNEAELKEKEIPKHPLGFWYFNINFFKQLYLLDKNPYLSICTLSRKGLAPNIYLFTGRKVTDYSTLYTGGLGI